MGRPAEDGRLARRALLVLGQPEVTEDHALVPVEQARPGRRRLGAQPPPPRPVMINRFAGFTSRWTMPASWSVPRPWDSARDDRLEPSGSTPGPSGSRSLSEPPRCELHDQVGAAVVELADVVHRHHVRAVDPPEELGLPDEAGPGVRVHGVAEIEDLDRGLAVERVVVRKDDHGEPAHAKHRPDLVAADPSGTRPSRCIGRVPLKAGQRRRSSW